MALKQVKTTNNFTPDMIGDVVEVMAYNKTDGSSFLAVGTLTGYQQGDGLVGAWFEHDTDGQPGFRVSTEIASLTITHYEWEHEFVEAEYEEDSE